MNLNKIYLVSFRWYPRIYLSKQYHFLPELANYSWNVTIKIDVYISFYGSGLSVVSVDSLETLRPNSIKFW